MKLEKCVPPLWAPNGHLQTLAGHFLPSEKLRSKGHQFHLTLTDGDQLVGFIQPGTSSTVVYVFHGLAGSSDSTYVHRTSILAQKYGHTVILANHRGCGEGAGLAKGPYHSGRGEDISAVIAHGRKLFPQHRHIAVGFSMSANALLLLVCGQRGDHQPDAALALNGPIDLLTAAQLLQKGFNRVYNFDLYRGCRRDAYIAGHEILKTTTIPRFASIYEFDRIYTAPTAGFSSREEYYRQCSTHEHLDKIKIPTIIITAKDDPFIGFQSYARAQFSSSVIFHSEDHGGHMGYISKDKTPLGTNRWQDYAVDQSLRFLNSI